MLVHILSDDEGPQSFAELEAVYEGVLSKERLNTTTNRQLTLVRNEQKDRVQISLQQISHAVVRQQNTEIFLVALLVHFLFETALHRVYEVVQFGVQFRVAELSFSLEQFLFRVENVADVHDDLHRIQVGAEEQTHQKQERDEGEPLNSGLEICSSLQSPELSKLERGEQQQRGEVK